MSSYNVNDTVYFNNDVNSNIDTLIVNEVYIHNEKDIFNHYPFSFRSEYKVTAGYGFEIKHKGNLSDNNYFSISKNYEDMYCFKNWNILGMISDNDTIFDTNEDYVSLPTGIRAKMITINIKKISFNDCIVGNYDNSHEYNYRNPMLIDEFVWSRQYGLLQYKKGGETYTRADIREL